MPVTSAEVAVGKSGEHDERSYRSLGGDIPRKLGLILRRGTPSIPLVCPGSANRDEKAGERERERESMFRAHIRTLLAAEEPHLCCTESEDRMFSLVALRSGSGSIQRF